MATGLAIRFAHLGLPRFVVKYGGSTLWALTIYWIVSALLPRWSIGAAGLLAAAVATAVEFVKLCHWPTLDAFRRTLPGVLLLGRFFSVWDVVAYWLAIAAGAALDSPSSGRSSPASTAVASERRLPSGSTSLSDREQWQPLC
jgi:Protein of unknown function (DUF2809)